MHLSVLAHLSLALPLVSGDYLDDFRASIVLAKQGKNRQAVAALDACLREKPLKHIRLQRARLHVTLGNALLAQQDLQELKIEERPDDLVKLADDLSAALVYSPSETTQVESKKEIHKPDCERLERVIAIAPQHVESRVLRLKCLDTPLMRISELLRLAALDPEPRWHYQLGQGYLLLGEPENALKHAKFGLKLDPEHQLSKKVFRTAKKILKLETLVTETAKDLKWKLVIEHSDAVLGLLGNATGAVRASMNEHQCKAYHRLNDYTQTVKICSLVLESNVAHFDSLMYRAQAYAALSDYSESMQDYEAASRLRPQDQRVRDGYNNVKLKLKKSKMVDYYKHLEIERDASPKQIKKVSFLTKGL